MAAEKDSPNPFAAYQGEEVELVAPKAAAHEQKQSDSMIAVAMLVIIAALLAFIAWRHRSR
ncbi:hypothetical protein [Sphingopyxis granuli]|uniref:hypothetical protein n=1 Tax=Sphingopyxis granuli TaxID=267128 RepID=UPI001BAFF5C4|nr:hypothetical protein [Sphingopyxis granuli]QUM73333.1 hypothetical protein ICN83_05455 [Sphingopyxis granuli]